MLLKYMLSNFCSFRDDTFFAMKPGKVMSRFEDNIIYVNPRLKISKSAVIVGENAGGKSNFISSLKYLKFLFEYDFQHRVSKSLSYNYDAERVQTFQITVLADNNMIYTYEIKLDSYSIISEQLYIRTANQTEASNKEIFHFRRVKLDNISSEEIALKTNSGIEFKVEINDNYIDSELKSIAQKAVYSKGLFINYLALIKVDIVIPFVDWINNKLIVEIPSDYPLNEYIKIRKEEEDLAIMKAGSFFEIFRLVDSSIAAIEIDDEKPFEKSIIVRKIGDDRYFRIELGNESSGVKEFFAWSIQLWKVLNKDAVLFADEIDGVFNPVLSAKIISLIHGSEHRGQFVFSTHNVLHLNTNDYMKEQLYFVSKNKETLSSELYSLADFKDYRYEKADVYDLYLRGILGGVPNV